MADPARPCPGCGVAVPLGYPRCPKCSALMPGAPGSAARPVGVRARDAGGTSVAAAPKWPWIAGAVALVAAMIAVAVVVTGGRERAPVAVESPVEVEDTDAAPDAPVATDDGDDDDDDDGDEPDVAVARAAALRQLRIDLDAARLWSRVVEDPADASVAVISSRECESDELSRIVADASAALRAGGVATVRCAEPHGQVVFERGL